LGKNQNLATPKTFDLLQLCWYRKAKSVFVRVSNFCDFLKRESDSCYPQWHP